MVMLRSLKMRGMAQGVGELLEPRTRCARLRHCRADSSQLLKVELVSGRTGSIAYQLKAARFPRAGICPASTTLLRDQ